MLRRSPLRLRSRASPVPCLTRGASRQTGRAEQTFNYKKSSWSSTRVLLFSSLVGVTAYYTGINHDLERFALPWRSKGPRYASKSEMEKACFPTGDLYNSFTKCSRPLTSCGLHLVRMPSAQTMKISSDTAIQNGRPSILISYLLPSHTLNPLNRCHRLPKSVSNTRYL